MRTLVASLLFATAAAAQPEIAAVQLPDGWGRTGATTRDMDGDGLLDLVVAARGPGGKRAIALHLQRDGAVAFSNEPDARLDVPADVTAFCVADLDEAPGEEVALLNARGAVLWRPRAEGAARFSRLAEADFLFQLPDDGEVLALGGLARDVDGDGALDLLLPEPGGYRVARRGGGTSVLEAPRDPPEEDGMDVLGGRARQPKTLSLRLGSTELSRQGIGQVKPPLLEVRESTPRPHLVDFDGDGRADVVARARRDLHVWLQDEDGGFPRAPSRSLELPVVADRGRLLDPSFATRVLDLDGDRRADMVVFATDRRSEDARTQILVYLHPEGAELFAGGGVPQQLLVVAGFAGAPELADFDGDGRADLVLLSLRPDVLDRMRSEAGRRVELELLVYRNGGGTFSRHPDLRFPVALDMEGRTSLRRTATYLVGDVSGDGLSDLVVREQADRIRLYLTRRRGGAAAFLERAAWERPVHEDGEIEVASERGRPVLFVKEPQQVLLVKLG